MTFTRRCLIAGRNVEALEQARAGVAHLADDASVIFTFSVVQQRGRPGDPRYAATRAAVRTLAADPCVLAKRMRVNVNVT